MPTCQRGVVRVPCCAPGGGVLPQAASTVNGRTGDGKLGDQGGPHAVSMRRAGRAGAVRTSRFPASMVIKQDFRPASADAASAGKPPAARLARSAVTPGADGE